MIVYLESQQAKADASFAASLIAVRKALEGLRFGQLTLIVHEGEVVQLDVTRKRRFPEN